MPTALEYAEIAAQLVGVYQRAETDIVKALAAKGGEISDWGRAFRNQQVAQIHGAIANIQTGQDQWGRQYIGNLYEHGLAVADCYLMKPADAERYKALRKEGLSHWDAVQALNGETGAPPPSAYQGLVKAGATHEEALKILETSYGPRTGWGPGGMSRAAHPGQVTPMNLDMVQLHTEAISEMQRALMKPLTTNAYRLDRNFEYKKLYRAENIQAIEEAFAQGMTQREAQKLVLKRLREKDLFVYVDAAGRKWEPKAYASMIARTTPREAEQEAMFRREVELGQDLVEVSDTPTTCPFCAPWLGKKLSLTGRTEGYTTVAQAHSQGFQHPNCIHVCLPWVSENADEWEFPEDLLTAPLSGEDRELLREMVGLEEPTGRPTPERKAPIVIGQQTYPKRVTTSRDATPVGARRAQQVCKIARGD